MTGFTSGGPTAFQTDAFQTDAFQTASDAPGDVGQAPSALSIALLRRRREEEEAEVETPEAPQHEESEEVTALIAKLDANIKAHRATKKAATQQATQKDATIIMQRLKGKEG